MDEFDRLTQTSNAKKGNEQNLFLVNAILMVKNINKLDWDHTTEDILVSKEESDSFLTLNMTDGVIKVKDYIVDMHCFEGKKKGCNGLTFAFEGSKIIDEDKEYFVKKYRDVYNNIKRIDTGEEIIEDIKSNDELPFIKWCELGKVNFCNNGNVCCNKRVCIESIYKGNSIVVKECGKGVNYGIDQVIVDRMKKFVGLGCMNVKRVKMDTIVRKINMKEKSYNDNFRMDKMDVIYLMMNKFDGEMLRDRKKNWYNNKKMRREYVKIGLFRGIFRVTDFNELNVLINDKDEMLSIDEMLIGKKKNILGNMSSELKDKLMDDYLKDDLKEVFDELNFDNKDLKAILKEMNCLDYYIKIKKNKKNLEDEFVYELNC
jgi:hypothetical protein